MGRRALRVAEWKAPGWRKGGNILAETVETRAPGMERQAFPFLMFGFLE
jgi:hypothetical protein